MILPLLAVLACAPRYHLVLYETAPVETTLGNDDLPDAAELWLDRVRDAKRSIDIAQFYAVDRPGSRLEPVVLALEAAASRGVRVRILADAGFAKTYPELLDRLGSRDRVDVRLLDLSERTGGVLHAKYMTIDGQRVLLGSQNFDWRSLDHIQELGVEVDHPQVVDAYEQVFGVDWALAGGETQVMRRDAPDLPLPVWYQGQQVTVLPVFSPQQLLPDPDTWDLPALVKLIDDADRRVRVHLLSYETRDYNGAEFLQLDQALRRAAARGVQVQLLLADWNQRASRISALQDMQRFANIEIRLSTIPQASEGFIPFARVSHCKYLVVDGEAAWIGTSNFGGGYFHESRNVGLIVSGQAVATRLDAFFEQLWDSDYAETVDPARLYAEPRYRE